MCYTIKNHYPYLKLGPGASGFQQFLEQQLTAGCLFVSRRGQVSSMKGAVLHGDHTLYFNICPGIYQSNLCSVPHS